MNINDYQAIAKTTAVYPKEVAVLYPTLGLAGESGEIAEKVKKYLRGDKDLNKGEIAKELGDVLWYVSALSTDLGYSLEEIAQMNIDKLQSRKARDVLKGDGDNR